MKRQPEEKKRKFRPVRMLFLAALLLAVAGALLLGAVRHFGLPAAVKERIRHELAAQGLDARAERLYLDWLGRVQARHIYITKTDRGPTALDNPGANLSGSMMVERAQVRFNWLSWWRGEPFLRGATIARANIAFRLDQVSELRLEDVSAKVTLHANDVTVDYLRGKWYNLRVDLAGVIDLPGMDARADKPGTAADKSGAESAPLNLGPLYRKVLDKCGGWTAAEPLLLTGRFHLPPARPLAGEARLRLTGAEQRWHGARVTLVDINVDYTATACALRGELALARGKFTLTGEWAPSTRNARLLFSSDADFSLLAPALPEGAATALRALRFNELPTFGGEAVLSWEKEFGFVVSAKTRWRDFLVGEQPFDLFENTLSYDGKRLMVTGLNLKGPAGAVAAEFFYDGEETARGRADCALDPRAVRALFGPGAQPFFDSLYFAEPPLINATVTGTGLAPEKLALAGKIEATNFSYKGVAILRATSDFAFRDSELHLAKLHVKRVEGEGGGEIWDNFKTKQVRVKGVKATLNAQDVALVLGDKMAEYMAPYQFVGTPTFSIDGLFDLDDAAGLFRTNMKARVIAKKGAHYEFMKRRLLLTDLDLNIAIVGQKLTLTPNKPITLFDGNLDGKLNVMLLRDATYDTRLQFANNDFGAVMKTFFGNDKVTGRVSGDINLRGAFDDMKTMKGDGTLTVRDGELYAIPFLGGLSELLNAIIPNLGYAKASEAESHFTVADGVIKIQKLDIKSLSFALIGTGEYNFIKDHLELDMRANVKGIIGVFTFPVSKLFEYHGTGPIANTKWETKNF